MLQDGKEIMTTFNDMFGKGASPMGNPMGNPLGSPLGNPQGSSQGAPVSK